MMRRGGTSPAADDVRSDQARDRIQQLRQTLADGVPPAPVLMDPAYGNDSKREPGSANWLTMAASHHDGAAR